MNPKVTGVRGCHYFTQPGSAQTLALVLRAAGDGHRTACRLRACRGRTWCNLRSRPISTRRSSGCASGWPPAARRCEGLVSRLFVAAYAGEGIEHHEVPYASGSLPAYSSLARAGDAPDGALTHARGGLTRPYIRQYQRMVKRATKRVTVNLPDDVLQGPPKSARNSSLRFLRLA